MNQVFARRLKSARTLAGISQDELVARVDHIVTKNAISKYEKGEMMPGSKIIIALASALGVKPDYFFREFSIKIDKVEFRKKSKLGIRNVNAIKGKTTDILERYLELEGFLNIRTRFKNPVQGMTIYSQSDVEKATKKLLKSWKLGINALPNVIELLEDHEIKVVEISAFDDFDGFSGWAEERYPIIILNKDFGSERKRLTALHELGHLVLDFDKRLQHREMEKRCFQFAGALLLPEETLKKELGDKRSSISIQELIAIKEAYGISIQAIMARAKDLNIIDDSRYLNFRKYINKNRTEKGLGNYSGLEYSGRFKQLLFRAASEELISMSKAANLNNQKLAAFRKEFVVL